MQRPIDRLIAPIQHFLHLEAAGGLLLLVCAVVALGIANSPLDDPWKDLLHQPLTLRLGGWSCEMGVAHLINDGLMAVFFLLVGLEIKRELLAGELAGWSKAALPVVAAVGGMLVPAGIYALANLGGSGIHGWGIPMATDIAFAVGIMGLLGDRVPLGLKVFLVALAIVDDLGAIVVIAAFYSNGLDSGALLQGLIPFGLLLAANRIGIRNLGIYLAIGVWLWTCVLASGIHATIAGVLLAITIPTRTDLDGGHFLERMREILSGQTGDVERLPAVLEEINAASHAVEAPSQRLERILHPWVMFVVMPVFALANAGVTLVGDQAGDLGAAALSPVAWGVALGLLLGKPLGIFAATWLAVRLGLGALPGGTTWRQILGAGALGGIGFTMSLFIAQLGVGTDAALLIAAKLGIFAGSIAAGIIGYLLLARRTPPRANGV